MGLPYWDPVAGLEAQRQWGAGRVFFVHAWNGNNDNNGINPNTPFETITYALAQCGDDNQDYIICMSTWTQEPAWPITVGGTHRAVHFIGPGRDNGTLGAYLYPGVTDEPTFLLLAVECEIAGFNMGGGATHGCIEIGSCMRSWIHHNWFGNQDQLAGNLPAYGVHAPTGPAGFMVCEDNVFMGDQVDVDQGISINGVDIQAGAWMTIRRNRFMGCTIGIRLVSCRGNMILDNVFACPDIQGAAITLIAHANCVGNMVNGNIAMEGDVALAANLFLDQNVGNVNHWGDNRHLLAAGAIASIQHIPA